MLVLGIDFETTGLDPLMDRITEVGAVLWDTETKTPVKVLSEFIWEADVRIKCEDPVCASMMERVSGITQKLLSEYGEAPYPVLSDLAKMGTKAQYIVAHNGNRFDKLFMEETIKRIDFPGTSCLSVLPWIDTKLDLPFGEPPESSKLKHLALEMGFMNPFPHRALFDVLTMLKVLSQFDINEVVKYREIPNIVIQAMVNYDNRELAKARKFQWEKANHQSYPKAWVKEIKAHKLDEEKKLASFDIAVLT